MKNLLKFSLAAICMLLTGYFVYAHQKDEVFSDMLLANIEALADGEDEVTCVADTGDTCLVGTTPVKDYDEKEDDSWWPF